MPEDQETWEDKFLMFATAKGGVRRNKLSVFGSIRSNGLIAMKLEEKDDELISVRVCDEEQDILLSTNDGRAIRFKVTDVRCFNSRNSTGVRGIRLDTNKNKVISMSILNHIEASSDERTDYLKYRNAEKRGENPSLDDYENLNQDKYEEMLEKDQTLLVTTTKGYGMKASIHGYRITNRGGKGISNMQVDDRNGEIVSSFIVEEDSQIILVTNNGQMIRTAVDTIRQTSRNSKGVKVFTIKDKENVISVAHIPNNEEEELCACGCNPEECECPPTCECGCNSPKVDDEKTVEVMSDEIVVDEVAEVSAEEEKSE